MTKSKKFLLVLSVIIIALFLRTYHLKELPPGLYPDEAMNGSNALKAIHAGEYNWFYPENNGREGLFINIQAQFVKIYGIHPWVLRLPSALFGTLTVLGIYFLGAELFTFEIGLAAAFFAATGFWHINFSRIGFRAITAPFYFVWASYFLLLGFRKLESGAKFYKISLYHVLAGLFAGLGFHSYIAYRAMPAAFAFAALSYLIAARRQMRLKPAVKAIAYFILIAAAAAFPLFRYFYANPGTFFGRTSQVSVFASESPLGNLALNALKTAQMFFLFGDFNWRHNLPGRAELFAPVAIAFLVGILAGFRKWGHRGLWSFWQKPVFPYFYLFVSAAAAALPVTVSNEGLPHALRAILIAPAVYILAGTGAVHIYNFLSQFISRKKIRIAGAVICALLFLEAYHTYFILWGKNQNTQGAFAESYVSTANKINALPAAIPKYVLVKAGGVLVNGIPMPAQTVMFLTDTYEPDRQIQKNVRYVLPEEESSIPAGSIVFTIK